MNNSPHNVYLFFGVVGAGKGTQVALLEKFFANNNETTLYISPGKECRKFIEGSSLTSQTMKETLDKGCLQPNFLVNTFVTDVLIPHYTGEQHLIFDGYPRKPGQSYAIEEMRLFYGWNKPVIIFIDLNKEEAIKRLSIRGRHDDTPEGITQRIDEYKNNVLPSLEQLKATGNYDYVEINGDQSIEQVHEDILKNLKLK